MLIAHRILLIIIITEQECRTQIAKCDGALKISIWCATSDTPCIINERGEKAQPCRSPTLTLKDFDSNTNF